VFNLYKTKKYETVSKIESTLDRWLAKLVGLKAKAKTRLSTIWTKTSPHLSKLKKLDLQIIKAYVIQYKWRFLLVLIVLYAGSKTYDYFFPAADKVGGPVTVTTIVVEKKDVPLIIEATGTIVSNNIVDIRPMITNTVSKILVKDGQEVKAGDLLFVLDDRNDKANYEKLKALADDAQTQYLRAKELVSKNFISKAGLDTSFANAKSAMAAAKAAEVQLSFDYIKSPIDGRAGIVNVFPGSLVQASNIVSTATSSTATSSVGAMVTITQLNPINVQFVIPEKDIPTILENQLDGDAMSVKVTVGETGKNIYEGKVIVIDNQVDPQIAAVRVKAQIPNDSTSLLPGQFARVSLIANTLKDALTVPSQAVIMSPRGKTVYVVGEGDKVTSKPVKVIYDYQGISVIDGVAPGDRIVVEGKQNLRPGGKIQEAKATPGSQTTTPSSPEKK
jgi:membrane fusion protein, multidrug efflux system